MSLSGPDQGGSGAAAGGSFGAMLALIADPAALAAKYAEFEARQKAAEDAIALVGPAGDVLRLRDEAQKAAEAAATALAEAKAAAQAVTDQATATAERILADAQRQASELTAAAAAQKAAVDADVQALAGDRATFAAARRELDNRIRANAAAEADLAARFTAANDLRKQYTDALATLQSVRDTVVTQFEEHLKTLTG